MTENNNFVHPSINQNSYPLEISNLVAATLWEDKRVRVTDFDGKVLKDFKPGGATRAKTTARQLSKAQSKILLVWFGRLVALQQNPNGTIHSFILEKI